jgi:Holliday junction resolvase RusA-like endonuclease
MTSLTQADMILDLPKPPSVNRIWRHRQGRKAPYLDTRYARWKRTCDNICMFRGWHKTPIKGHYTAIVTIDETKRVGDIDNRIKVVLDFLKQAGITEDDSLCDEVTARFGFAPEGCRVELAPSPRARLTKGEAA